MRTIAGMPNTSKIRDPRQWRKWRASGAVLPNVELFKTETAAVFAHLQNVRHIGGFPEDLCGLCAIGAHMVADRLRRLGYTVTLIDGDDGWGGHCWVEVAGYICDPTAGQFPGCDPWHVIKITRAKPYAWESYNRNPDFSDWPPSQNPRSWIGQQLMIAA